MTDKNISQEARELAASPWSVTQEQLFDLADKVEALERENASMKAILDHRVDENERYGSNQ